MSYMASLPNQGPYDDRHHFTVEDVTRIILNDMVERLPDQNQRHVTPRCQRTLAGGECARCPNCTGLRIVR